MSDNSSLKDNVRILCNHFKTDNELKLCNDESSVQVIIKSSIQNVETEDDKVRELKKVVSLPSTYIFASLSSQIYDYDEDGRRSNEKTVNEEIDQKLVNWQLLTVAHNYGSWLRCSKNGYFGAAYWNPDMRQVVIVHSGTRNIGGVFADLNGIILNEHTSQVNSALTFTFFVIDILRKFKKHRADGSQEGPYIQVFFTGHSLGAWLSQITSFAAKYMMKVGDNFIASDDFEKTGYHAITVVFDSPGCKNTLQRIQSSLIYRSSPCLINSLNITTYMSAPNLINACNAYFGDVYRVSISLSEEEKNSWWNMNIKYTFLMHQMKKIKEAFNTESGEVLIDDDGQWKLRRVIDWPLLTTGNEGANYTNKIISLIAKIPKILPSMWYPKFYQELGDFFKFANKSTEFHPDEKSMDIKIGEIVCRTVRYQTKELDADYKNEQNINVFTQSERRFLERYKFLMQNKDSLSELTPETLFSPLCEELIDTTVKMLKDYEVHNETISSKDLAQFIPFVKRMLYFFPQVEKNVEYNYGHLPIHIRNKVYQRASSWCLRSVENSLEFADTVGVDDFLKNENKCILHTIHSSISIGFSRIYTILKSLNNDYRDKKYHAFLNLDIIFRLGERSLIDFLKDFVVDKTYLLIVVCDDALNNKIEEFFQALFKLVTPESHIKIVLITENDTDMNEFLKNCTRNMDLDNSCHTTSNVEISFNDLTEDSQEILLEKNVIFQGKHINLKTIINRKSDHLNEIFNSEIITELIKNRRIEIGKPSITLGKVEDYFVDRMLVRKVKIKSESFKEFLKHNYTDSDNCELNADISFQGEKYINDREKLSELSRNISETDFEKLCRDNSGNFRWIEEEGNDFSWIRSYGTLSGLRKFVSSSGSIVNMNQMNNFQEKFIIIASEPGMGKSTALTYLGVQNTSQESNPIWIVRINLAEHRDVLNDDIDFNNIDNIIAFLHADESTIACTITRKLMKSRFGGSGDIILLFDGFDEISFTAQKNILQLLHTLETTQVKKVFISTRLHLRDQLEDALSTVAYTFQPFSLEDQKDFLKQFWKHHALIDMHEIYLSYYITRLLILISKSIHGSEKSFMGIPLQLQMIAEAFQDELDLPEDLDIRKLYDRFILTKYRIYFKKKCENIEIDEVQNNWFIAKSTKAHANLAFSVLFPNVESRYLKCELPSEQEKETMRLIGIVQFINDEIIFVHRTFAEYFAAKFLVDKLNRENNELKYKETLDFLGGKFFLGENEVTKTFLDHFLANENILLDAFKGNLKNVRALVTSGTSIKCTDVLGRNALHYAAQKEHKDIVRFLLENNFLPNSTDRLEKTPLHYAARYNSSTTSVVQLLIYANPKSIDDKDRNGCTAVFYASECNHSSVASHLMENGADASQVDSPLSILCQMYEQYLKVASLDSRTKVMLYHDRVSKTTQDHEGNTSLHVAVMRKDIEMVDYLLAKGVNPKFRNNGGKNPLNCAAENKNWSIVESFLRKGASIDELNDTQKLSLFEHSLKASSWDIITLYMGNKNRDAFVSHLSEQQIQEFLYFCISNRFLSTVGYLASQDTEWRDFKKSMHRASVFVRHHRTIDFLKKKGADWNNLNIKQKLLLLMYASRHNRWNGFEQFLEDKDVDFYINCIHEQQYYVSLCHFLSKGTLELARVFTEKLVSKQIFSVDDFINNQRKTLLHVAAENGNLDISRYLVDEGVFKLDAVTNSGWTPLHLATENNKLDVVRYLIRKGADIKIADNGGRTCESIANDKGYLDMVIFLKGVPEVQGELFQLVKSGEKDFRKVDDLINQGADVNARSSDGDTPLFLATQNNDIEMVEYLLEEGADFTITTRNRTAKDLAEENNYDHILTFLKEAGKKMLFDAIRHCNTDKINCLINEGIDINATRKDDDFTPLHLAAYNGNLDIVKQLVAKGAKVDVKDKCQNTPKYYSSQNGYSDVASYLQFREILARHV